MAHEDRPNPEDWRLGFEPDEHVEGATPPAEPQLVDLSSARLAHPLYTLTAEHLGWALVAIFTVASRTFALGGRSLSAAESRAALAAFSIAEDGIGTAAASVPLHFSWVQIAEGWIFASIGVSDSSSRLVAMSCGLILVAAAFATRRYVGRAGALALAVMFALSPSIAYYSRTGSGAVPAGTFAFLAVVMFVAVSKRPARLRAALLGCSIGLALAADSSSLVTLASAAVALSMFGLWNAATGQHLWLRTRVWWHRRRGLVMTTIVVAAVVWATLATAVFSRPLVATFVTEVRAGVDISSIDFRAGLHQYVPIFVFYDVMIAILALAGAVAVVARRASSPLAVWAMIWALITAAGFVAAPPFRSDRIVEMLVPMALLGAVGVEWLHHLDAWRSIRYPLAALAALTLYTQALTGFIFAAPNSTEAPWARHALLFWSEPATSQQTPAECAHAAAQVSGADVTVFIPDDAPSIEWYFPSMDRATSPDDATIVVQITPPGASANSPRTDKGFVFEETWTPNLHALSLKSALQFIVDARPWSDVKVRDAEFLKRVASTPAAGPTPVTPGAAPSSAPTTPAMTPTPAATPTPASSPTAAATPTRNPGPLRTD